MKKNKKMIQIFRAILIIASLFSLTFVPWILVKAWIRPLPNTVQEQVQQAIDYGLDGMIVYVDQAGKPPAFYSGGYNNRDKKTPADPKSLFKIASITKLYVAVATAKLVKSKQLSLDKTLADYFPELVGRIENADKITLRMMVQHRSGIPDFTDNGYWANPLDNRAEKLELVLDLPANFKPGKSYEYSNTNYLLISNLIDKVVGYPHQQYIKEQILIPLGLHNTFGSLNDVDLEKVMSGYYVGIENDLKTDNSGLMIATAEDVGKFIRALNDGSVFNKDEREIYETIYEFKHGGLIPGYQSLAEYHKEIDAVVVQFINTTDFEGYEWNLSQIIYNRIVKIIKKGE